MNWCWGSTQWLYPRIILALFEITRFDKLLDRVQPVLDAHGELVSQAQRLGYAFAKADKLVAVIASSRYLSIEEMSSIYRCFVPIFG